MKPQVHSIKEMKEKFRQQLIKFEENLDL